MVHRCQYTIDQIINVVIVYLLQIFNGKLYSKYTIQNITVQPNTDPDRVTILSRIYSTQYSTLLKLYYPSESNPCFFEAKHLSFNLLFISVYYALVCRSSEAFATLNPWMSASICALWSASLGTLHTAHFFFVAVDGFPDGRVMFCRK